MSVHVAKIPEHPGAARETSWWPALVGLTLTLFLSGFPVSHALAGVGLVLFLASVVGWTWSNALRPPPEEGSIGGHSRVWQGMVLLIVSEVGLFLTGFVALTAHPDVFGPQAPRPFLDLNRPLTLVASLVLWSSGFAGARAVKAFEREDRRKVVAWLATTLGLGFAFVCYQAFEYHRLIGEGFTLQSGGAGALFYFLTGLHGLHVLAGLVVLAAVLGLFAARRLGRTRAPVLRAAMLYWHFVDAAWVAIYAVLYLKWV